MNINKMFAFLFVLLMIGVASSSRINFYREPMPNLRQHILQNIQSQFFNQNNLNVQQQQQQSRNPYEFYPSNQNYQIYSNSNPTNLQSKQYFNFQAPSNIQQSIRFQNRAYRSADGTPRYENRVQQFQNPRSNFNSNNQFNMNPNIFEQVFSGARGMGIRNVPGIGNILGKNNYPLEYLSNNYGTPYY